MLYDWQWCMRHWCDHVHVDSRKQREAKNAQKNAHRAAMRAHFRRKYQLSKVGLLLCFYSYSVCLLGCEPCVNRCQPCVNCSITQLSPPDLGQIRTGSGWMLALAIICYCWFDKAFCSHQSHSPLVWIPIPPPQLHHMPITYGRPQCPSVPPLETGLAMLI